ncbi:MAG: COG4705 family protein [Jatrophihabitantaceae bacterium]
MSAERSGTLASTTGRTLAVKVPEVTAFFWLVKALTTAFGESASDFMVHSMNPVVAVLIGFVVFCVALLIQLRAPRYLARLYWFAVAMVGVFGTMAADVLHVGFGVPYLVSTILFVVVLAAVFITWQACEHTLSIHSVRTRQRELFYWAAVVATFALGTAAGDMMAVTVRLGYFSSGLLFAGAIAVPAVGYWRFGLNPILAFWTAYVLTRPLGASFADWFGVSHARGGLALGPGPVSLVLAALIVGFVVYLARTKLDVPRERDQTDSVTRSSA